MEEHELRPADSNLLIYVRNHTEAILSGVISTIAMDRLNYKVTDKTQFKLSPDFTRITISETKQDDEGSPIKAAKEKK